MNMLKLAAIERNSIKQKPELRCCMFCGIDYETEACRSCKEVACQAKACKKTTKCIDLIEKAKLNRLLKEIKDEGKTGVCIK